MKTEIKRAIAILLVVLFCGSPLQTLANEVEKEEIDATQEENLIEKEFPEEPIVEEEAIEEKIVTEEVEETEKDEETENRTNDDSLSKDDCTPVIVDEVPYEKATVSTRAVIGQWIQEANGRWWFRYNNGTYPQNCWAFIYGEWYFFDATGYLVVNQWLEQGGLYYHVNSDGVMARGWRFIGTAWYYFNASGVMQQGWLQQGSTWYYLIPGHGVMVNNSWYRIGNVRYFFNEGGALNISRNESAIERRTQERTNWCWAATAQMMGNFYNNNPSQTGIVRQIKGAVINEGGSFDEIRDAITFATGRSTVTYNVLPLGTIQVKLSNAESLALRMRWRDGTTSHAMVIGGVNNDLLRLIDPAPGARGGIYFSNYNNLLNGTQVNSGFGRYTNTWGR